MAEACSNVVRHPCSDSRNTHVITTIIILTRKIPGGSKITKVAKICLVVHPTLAGHHQ